MSQYSIEKDEFLNTNKSIYECFMLADSVTGELNSDYYRAFVNAGYYTPKGRLQTSQQQVTYFSTNIFGSGNDFWDNYTANNATIIHSPNESAILMSVANTAGSECIRQTKQVMQYVPGRTAEFTTAFILTMPIPGIRKRIGCFDKNNGFYFEELGTATGADYSVVLRSSVTGTPVETRVLRENWNGDKLDGTGPSGIIATPDTIHLLMVTADWYGAGSVQFQFVIDGRKHVIHTFYNANRISNAWSAIPFVPIRKELTNVSSNTAATLLSLSSAFSLDGSSTSPGVAMSQGRFNQTLATKDVFYPTVSIRMKSTALNSVNILRRMFGRVHATNSSWRWKIIVNAELTGANWVPHELQNSTIEVDVSATAVANGMSVLYGIGDVGGGSIEFEASDAKSSTFQLGRSNLGANTDTFTIAVASTGTNDVFDTVIRWREAR